MTRHKALFGAFIFALVLLGTLSVFALPSVGDPATSVEGVKGWKLLADPPHAWTMSQADGWTVGVIVRDSSILRVDWWKTGSLEICQDEFTWALQRVKDKVDGIVMLGGWQAVAMQIRGKLVVATILSVSDWQGEYIMTRSDVLVGRIP